MTLANLQALTAETALREAVNALASKLSPAPVSTPATPSDEDDAPEFVAAFAEEARRAQILRTAKRRKDAVLRGRGSERSKREQLEQIDQAAMEKLKRYRWPGNVRELENLVRRLAALYPQETITAPIVEAELQPATSNTGFAGNAGPERAETLSGSVERHLNQYFGGFGENIPPPGLYHRILKDVEYPLLSAALAATRGNQIKAAALLGINRNTLRKKIKHLNVSLVR
mgnify:CR=1 FL=1